MCSPQSILQSVTNGDGTRTLEASLFFSKINIWLTNDPQLFKYICKKNFVNGCPHTDLHWNATNSSVLHGLKLQHSPDVHLQIDRQIDQHVIASRVWCHMPVVPALWEVEVEDQGARSSNTTQQAQGKPRSRKTPPETESDVATQWSTVSSVKETD